MRVAVFLVCAALLAGCIYEQPLAPGKAETPDGHVLGDWGCVAPDSDKPAMLKVTLLANQRYQAVFGPTEDDQSVFQAYAVSFAGSRLLNVQEVVDGEPRKWTMARYALLRPRVLHVEFARDEPFRQATTQDERIALLRRLLKRDQLFEDYCTCVRVTTP